MQNANPDRETRLDPYALFDASAAETGDDMPALFRLSLLHSESIETARLANILGRAPLAAGLLALGAAATALTAYPSVAPAMLACWLAFIGSGIVALLRVYRQAERSPFELAALRSFVSDLHAVLLYAGFAWGAGAYLALPPGSNSLILLAFSVGASGVMALAWRARAASLYFLAPAMAVAIAAALSGPSGAGPAMLILALGISLGAATELAERFAAKRLGTLPLPLIKAL